MMLLLKRRPPPSATLLHTLLPYTTLFRSDPHLEDVPGTPLREFGDLQAGRGRPPLRDAARADPGGGREPARSGQPLPRLRVGGRCGDRREIGREHVCTPVTNAHLLCRLLLSKKQLNSYLADSDTIIE